jgi:hypothetical protein
MILRRGFRSWYRVLYRVLANGGFCLTTKPAKLRSFYPGADIGSQGAIPECPCDGRVSLRGCEQARWESQDLAVFFVQENERRRDSLSLSKLFL